MLNKLHYLLGAAGVALVAAAPANAQYGFDDDQISISGTVAEADDYDSFVLDYGTGEIEVETEDLVEGVGALDLDEGDSVVVYGEADNDLFEGRVIEADRVYAATAAVYYFDRGTEEMDSAGVPDNRLLEEEGSYATFTGTISDIEGREFTLDTGENEISVDTLSLASNPLDDRGRQRLQEGDQIIVSGTVDDALFDERELSAMQITSLPPIEGDGARMSGLDDQAVNERSERNRASGGNNETRNRSAEDLNREGERMARQASRERQNAQRTEAGSDQNERLDRVRRRAMGREFALLDTNDNGTVSRSEYVENVADAGNITRREARRLFDAAAGDDDTLTRAEFLEPSEEYDQLWERYLAANQ